jgi:hypothetical protein
LGQSLFISITIQRFALTQISLNQKPKYKTQNIRGGTMRRLLYFESELTSADNAIFLANDQNGCED